MDNTTEELKQRLLEKFRGLAPDKQVNAYLRSIHKYLHPEQIASVTLSLVEWLGNRSRIAIGLRVEVDLVEHEFEEFRVSYQIQNNGTLDILVEYKPEFQRKEVGKWSYDLQRWTITAAAMDACAKFQAMYWQNPDFDYEIIPTEGGEA